MNQCETKGSGLIVVQIRFLFLDDHRETTPLVEKFQESDQFRFQCVTSAICPSVALCSSIFEVHMLFCTSQSKRDCVFYTAPAGEQNFFSFTKFVDTTQFA